MSECLAYFATHPVTIHRSGKQAFGNNHAQSGYIQLVWSGQNLEQRCTPTAPVVKNPLKLHRFQQTLAARKRIPTNQARFHPGWFRYYLYCQAMAAFGTTCVDYGAATARFHTHTKAVGALAAGNGGLIGTFHFLLPLSNQTGLVGLNQTSLVGLIGLQAKKPIKNRVLYTARRPLASELTASSPFWVCCWSDI